MDPKGKTQVFFVLPNIREYSGAVSEGLVEMGYFGNRPFYRR